MTGRSDAGRADAKRSGTRRSGAFRALVEAFAGRGRHSLASRLSALPRLRRDAVTRRYPGPPPERALAMLLAIGYVVSPVDLVPELFLAVAGLADDAVVLAWLAGAVLEEVDAYLDWTIARERTVPGTVAD